MTEQQQQPAVPQPQPMQQPAQPQPQPMQQPAQPQPQPMQQPAQPQPSMITFATTAPQPVQPAQVSQPLQPANGSYQSIIEQQQAQIDALIQQNNNLNAQVTQMVQNGAQFGQPMQQPMQPMQQPMQPMQPAQFPNVYQPADMQAHPLSTFNPASLANDEDYSLESLAKDIGKRENN